MNIKEVITISNLICVECLHEIAIKSLFHIILTFVMIPYDFLTKICTFGTVPFFFKFCGTVNWAYRLGHLSPNLLSKYDHLA